MKSNIIFESATETIRVARFLRPDVREALYDHEAIPETSLYKELHSGAIAGLPKSGTVILNFGLIDWFPTAFYRVLIQALQDARSLGGRVVLCCLTENVKEGFEIMGGRKLFEVHSTEARALAACQGKK
ncbi:MAG TPA: STAS domain-containing protein [Gemmata sp.]|jgi:anti-anti-sigma factor|nr:STAS domain-containing protein [Gemmata sp.]